MPARRVYKILIVEDESLIGWSMANALKRAGYEPEVVECADDALREMAAGHYDLVISDNRLTGMGGMELAIRMKTISRHTPLVLVAAGEDPGLEDLERSEMVDFLVEKPFKLNEMVALVGSILDSADRGHFPLRRRV
ncbi:MAG TPA: response regulator [Bacteroidota bacterium]|nr:response regulator [Bacteroidota bacterium]